MSACFDWFSCTFGEIKYENLIFFYTPDAKFLNCLLLLLGSIKKFEDFKTEKGRNTYKFRIDVDEGISIHFKGPENKYGKETTMVDITGTGCRKIDKLSDGWKNLFLFLKKYSVNYTRLDLALDDFSGETYSIEDLLKDVQTGNFTSIWRTRPQIVANLNGEKYEGITIYFGRRNISPTFLRVYDKLYEQLNKKGEIIINTKYWVRWEMVFSDRAAEMIDLFLASELGKEGNFLEFASKILYGLLQINNPKYNDFLQNVKMIKTNGRKFDNSVNLDIKINWMNDSCFRSIMAIYLAYGEEEFMNWLMHGIANEISCYEDRILNEVNTKGIFTDFQN